MLDRYVDIVSNFLSTASHLFVVELALHERLDARRAQRGAARCEQARVRAADRTLDVGRLHSGHHVVFRQESQNVITLMTAEKYQCKCTM